MAQNKRKKFRLNNLTGGMNTTSEEHSYNTIDPNALYGAGMTEIQFEFVNQDNWEVINRGGISKDYGFSLHYYTGTNSPITGLHRYKKSDGTSLFMYAQGTKVYKLVGGVATDIGATFTNNAYIDFENANDYLILCDGASASPPRKWDGTTVSALGGSPQNAIRQTLYAQNRLFMFPGSGETSYLYYSDAGNIEAGYGANFINCNRHNGQKLTSIHKLFIPGELRPLVFTSKEGSIGIIDGTGAAADPFVFKEVASDLGVPGFRQAVYFEQDIAFLTPKGVSTYQTAQRNVNFKEKFISDKVRDQFSALSGTTLPAALSFYDWKNDRIGFAVATGANTYPDTIWFYNIRTGGWRKKTGFKTTTAFVDDDGSVYLGSDTGHIYKLDPNVHNYNGSAIMATVQTPSLEFFEPDMFKRIVYSEITVRANGSYSLTLNSSLDDGTRTAAAIALALTAGPYLWGGGVWTSDPAVYQWGDSQLKRYKFYPTGIFKNRSFTLINNDANAPVDIVDWVIEVEYLSQH